MLNNHRTLHTFMCLKMLHKRFLIFLLFIVFSTVCVDASAVKGRRGYRQYTGTQNTGRHELVGTGSTEPSDDGSELIAEEKRNVEKRMIALRRQRKERDAELCRLFKMIRLHC